MRPAGGRPVRLGLIGCGRIACAVHLRVLGRAPRVRLVAVADPDPEARRRAQHLTRATVYERADELLAAADVEGVVVCAPSGEHARIGIAAAEAGKHLYMEKPLAITLEEATAVADAVRAAGIVAVVGLNRRAHPIFEQGRRLLASGRIGRVRAVEAVFCEPLAGAELPVWKRRRETGGGVLLDLASHHFDLLRWLLDDEIASVEASLRSEATEQDSAWVEVGLAGGVEARCFFSFRSGTADFIELVGERGVLRLDRYVPPVLLTMRREGLPAMRRARVPQSRAIALWRMRRLVRPADEPSYRRSLSRFVRRLQGHPVELPSLDDGLRSLEAVLAAEASALSGAPVAQA
jgi:myo-inositol 2-dehydrogenase / D-chiro-inositol 1-dehydrogenase